MTDLGGQTVTLVEVARGAQGRFERSREPARRTVVRGCHGRILTSREVVSDTDVATEIWKWTLRPVPAALAATPAWELEYRGVRQLVTGVHIKTDLSGSPSHVTVYSERQHD